MPQSHRPPALQRETEDGVDSLDLAMEEYRRGVWGYLRVLGADPDLADDLCQESFLRLVRWRDGGGEIRSARAWLRTTARNLYFDGGRGARGGLTMAPVDVEQALAERSRDDDGEAYRQSLRWALQRLRPQYRLALQQRYQPGGSRAQVAAALDLSDEGAKTVLRRARKELMTRIKARLDDA